MNLKVSRETRPYGDAATRPGPALVVLLSISIAFGLAPCELRAQKKRRASPTVSTAQTSTRSLTIHTEPNTVVWLDEVRRGVTDGSGQLTLTKVSAGRHILRVRAQGFQERAIPLLPATRGRLEVRLVRTTDEAEIAFQQAEEAREKASGDEARHQAAELYRRAIKLRLKFPAAHLGLARVLLDLNDYNTALDEIAAARRERPVYPEASAVEGRILRGAGDLKAAIESYQRAIREARGFQPEAYTGLGIVLEEEGKYEEAIAALRKAVAQLSDTEPVLYELLGRVYERLEKYQEAIAAYEKYLQLAPDGKLAPAIRSIVEQLRQQPTGDIPLPNP